MATRPVVSVFAPADCATAASTIPLPGVFEAPIRTDIVQFVHTNMNKNSRQAYAVFRRAGHQHSAISWGTGRAVACVPRVSGGGTARSGQGAFANMCRKGRMFAPTKTWRRWHRKINLNQRRFAVASALSASAVPALVMARGHRVEEVPEIPFVVKSDIAEIKKTKEAVAFLKAAGCYADIEKVSDSKKIRCGKGKLRNRRYRMHLGPMLVHAEGENVAKAFRNIPGVEICNVERMNLLRLAPGGHVGRFLIWTEAAFNKLDAIYGNGADKKSMKADYVLPQKQVTTADIARIINSTEVQSHVRPAMKNVAHEPKANPLRNKAVMDKLNPYASIARAAVKKTEEQARKNRKANVEKARAASAKLAAKRTAYLEHALEQ